MRPPVNNKMVTRLEKAETSYLDNGMNVRHANLILRNGQPIAATNTVDFSMGLCLYLWTTRDVSGKPLFHG